MAQYINKDVLIAEIDKLVDKGKYQKEFARAYRDGNNNALYALKEKINTLEVKEVDLEKELEDWLGERVGKWTGKECERMCRYFFELGFKAQKGE
jgi:hypothetical protein